jgi:hypothetical protein
MWLLTFVILVNGGASPSRFETAVFQTEKQCIIGIHRRESETRFGYCERLK